MLEAMFLHDQNSLEKKMLEGPEVFLPPETYKILILLKTLNHYVAQQGNPSKICLFSSDLTREMEGGWNIFAMVVPSTIPVSGAAALKN